MNLQAGYELAMRAETNAIEIEAIDQRAAA